MSTNQEANKEYKRSIEDEIDWKIIGQLHNATNNFSSKSLEIKRMFVLFIGVLIPVAIKLSNDALHWTLFASLYVAIICFWLVDSYTYFFQEKLRGLMDKRFVSISFRNGVANSEDYVIKRERVENRGLIKSLAKSMFNFSHLLYYKLFFLNSAALGL